MNKVSEDIGWDEGATGPRQDQKYKKYMSQDQNKIAFALIIRDRERIVFSGTAKSLSSVNERGVFDILPEHTNFISIIKDHLTVHKADGGSEDIKIDHGVVKVFANSVAVYLGFLPLPEK